MAELIVIQVVHSTSPPFGNVWALVIVCPTCGRENGMALPETRSSFTPEQLTVELQLIAQSTWRKDMFTGTKCWMQVSLADGQIRGVGLVAVGCDCGRLLMVDGVELASKLVLRRSTSLRAILSICLEGMVRILRCCWPRNGG